MAIDTELKIIPLKVHVTRETRRLGSWLRGHKIDQAPPVTLDLVILPRVIGNLSARVIEPVYRWQRHPLARYSQTKDLNEPWDFIATVPKPSTGEQPIPGEMRWVRGSASASCDDSFNQHRRLPNGQYLPITHRYFTVGWKSPQRCRSHALHGLASRIEAGNAFANDVGYVGQDVFNLRLQDGYCTVTATEIIAQSPITSGCDFQSVSLKNYSTFSDRFTVRVEGRVPAPMKARWTATAEAEIFSDQNKTTLFTTEPVTVRHGENVTVEFELSSSSSFAVEYVFESGIVPSMNFVAEAPPNGFQYQGMQQIGELRRLVTFGYELKIN